MAYKWACLFVAFWLAALITIFMFKYMPRIERIMVLEKKLRREEKRNSQLTEKYTLEIIGRTDDAAYYAIDMGKKQAEIEKQKGLADKWAAEAEKFRRKAEETNA